VPPGHILLLKLAASAFVMLVLGFLVFQKLKTGFYDYL
jgi:hypothetical protein